MAKSLRSKWKRKQRSVKRVRYGEKENKVLEKMLKNTDERNKILESVTETCKMLRCNVGNCTLKHEVPQHRRFEIPRGSNEGPQPLGDTTLDAVAIEDKMDCVGKSKTYSVKTKRDENGTHPAWMSKRKIQNLKSKPKSKTAKSIDGSGRVVKKRRAGKMKGKKYT